MQIEEAIRHALDGDATLFLGAGFSADAETASGANLPTGVKFANVLATRLGLHPAPSLDLVADMYRTKFGDFDLIQLLTDSFSASKITPEQEAFGTVPWRRIYTTNYDNVIELAHKKAGRTLISYTQANPPDKVPSRDAICLHINGSIAQLDSSALGTTFLLTNTAYLSDAFNRSRWSRLFREDIAVSRAVIFVGYSLYDIDIARILHATPGISKKCYFVVSDKPSAETIFGDYLVDKPSLNP